VARLCGDVPVLWWALRRRAGPAAGPGRAVDPAGRLRCDARVGVAPPNSLRSPSVRCARTTAASQSTKRADARRPRPCASRRPRRPRGRARGAARAWHGGAAPAARMAPQTGVPELSCSERGPCPPPPWRGRGWGRGGEHRDLGIPPSPQPLPRNLLVSLACSAAALPAPPHAAAGAFTSCIPNLLASLDSVRC
jgi:hypothetical protein